MANGNQNQGLLDQIGTGLNELRTSPAFNVGLGLLSAAGPQQQPMSTGQRLASGLQSGFSMQQRAMQNQAQRQELQQRQRQREAQQDLTSLLQQDFPPSTIRRPGAAQDRRERMMGLMAQAQPQAFQQSLLEQMTAQPQQEPEELQLIRALQDPTLSADQRELLKRRIAGSGANDRVMQRLDMLTRMAELRAMEREAQERRETEREERADMQSSMRQEIRDAKRLAEINRELRGTALETGLPMPELRRQTASAAEAGRNILGAVTGEDLGDRETQRTIALFDEFGKLSSRFASQTANRLFGEGGLTNQQLASATRQAPSASLAPGANATIIASQLDTLLSGAQRAGVNLTEDEVRETRNLIEQLRSFGAGDQQGGQNGGGDGQGGPAMDVTGLQPAGPAPSATEFDEEQQPVLGFAERLPQQRQSQIQQAAQYIRNASSEELTEFADRANELPPQLQQELDRRLEEMGF